MKTDVVTLVSRILSTGTILELTNRPYNGYEKDIKKLPKEPVPGLREECKAWIRHWGSGGGDYSTEACISGALSELGTDIPAEVANVIYESIEGYCKSRFEASLLAMDIVHECIREVEEAQKGEQE